MAEIVIIGAAIIDILVRPAEAKVFEVGSYPAEEIHMTVGGDALNEATILTKHGKSVRLETVLGNDEAGNYVCLHCERYGIELPEDVTRDSYITGINVVLVQESGERNFLTNRNGSLRKLRFSDIHMPFPKETKIICFASIFVFPEIGAKELEIIFANAKKQNKILCADMTKRKGNETIDEFSSALKYVDYLIPNAEEAMLLTGEATVEKAAERLWESGVKHVVVKSGKKGCYLRSAQESVWIPACKCEACVDTTGAGDSFVAGFIYALSEGKEFKICASYANQCGARAVEVIGATEWL